MCRGETWLRFERATARTEDERATIVPATRLYFVEINFYSQNAHIGAGPITVTQNRMKAVDFTLPIYSFEAVGVRYRPPGPSDDLQVRQLLDSENIDLSMRWLKYIFYNVPAQEGE